MTNAQTQFLEGSRPVWQKNLQGSKCLRRSGRSGEQMKLLEQQRVEIEHTETHNPGNLII